MGEHVPPAIVTVAEEDLFGLQVVEQQAIVEEGVAVSLRRIQQADQVRVFPEESINFRIVPIKLTENNLRIWLQ